MTLFQPSEFMKIAYIIMLSRVIVTFHKYYPNRKIREDFMLIGYMTLFTIPVLILLALQKDLGTSLVFVAIFSGMLLLSGVSWKILLPTALTGIVLVGGFMLILFLLVEQHFSTIWGWILIKSIVLQPGLIPLKCPINDLPASSKFDSYRKWWPKRTRFQ